MNQKKSNSKLFSLSLLYFLLYLNFLFVFFPLVFLLFWFYTTSLGYERVQITIDTYVFLADQYNYVSLSFFRTSSCAYFTLNYRLCTVERRSKTKTMNKNFCRNSISYKDKCAKRMNCVYVRPYVRNSFNHTVCTFTGVVCLFFFFCKFSNFFATSNEIHYTYRHIYASVFVCLMVCKEMYGENWCRDEKWNRAEKKFAVCLKLFYVLFCLLFPLFGLYSVVLLRIFFLSFVLFIFFSLLRVYLSFNVPVYRVN